MQGLETGAADQDEDGQITVDELHEYAREKVQEAAPTMQPEIYAVREGYKIRLARAPQGDPRLTYRKELDDRAKQKRGRLSPVDHRALKFRCQELGLSAEEAEAIANEVLQPYRIFWAKLNEFEQAVRETLEVSPQLDAVAIDDLRYFQRILKLRDEDITSILNTHNLNLDSPPAPSPAPAPNESVKVLTQATSSKSSAGANQPPPTPVTPLEDDLRSETGVDYTRLRDLLKAQDWKAADRETYSVMIRAVGKKEGDWFTSNELLKFPCKDLKTIDSLWVKYSNGHFGFSVQKQIYVECGGKLDGKYPGDKIWREFGDLVGWLKDGNLVSYNELNPSLLPPKEFSPTELCGI